MKGHIVKNKFREKPVFLVGDLNINSLDYSRNTHVRDVFNFIFQNGNDQQTDQSNQIECNSNWSYPSKHYNGLTFSRSYNKN